MHEIWNSTWDPQITNLNIYALYYCISILQRGLFKSMLNRVLAWVSLTTLQPINGECRNRPTIFRPCHKNGLIRTIPTTPHNLCVTLKSVSLPFWGLRPILLLLYSFTVKLPRTQNICTVGYCLTLYGPLLLKYSHNLCLLTEFDTHQRLESCALQFQTQNNFSLKLSFSTFKMPTNSDFVIK